MALYKRKNVYWIGISHNGQRIQRTTGTSDKIAAQRLHDKIKADLWNQSNLEEKPKYSWKDAIVRWIKESSHKKTLCDDIARLRWLAPHLENVFLHEIDRNLIQKVAEAKAQTGASNGTINRMLALIRSILNKAVNEWEWLEKAPKIKLRKEENHRIRWITPAQAAKLIAELPKHLADMVTFSLATGLRQRNVADLKWEEINLDNCHAWIHADEAKGNKAISIPLNEDAMAVLRKRRGKDPIHVFTYRGKPLRQVNTKAWKNALARAEIKDFRWHDLRHTWASWHVQNQTSLQELQQLGGWSSFTMVLRYAHLSSSHLRDAASRIVVTNCLHSQKKGAMGVGATASNLLN
jgi:integrase